MNHNFIFKYKNISLKCFDNIAWLTLEKFNYSMSIKRKKTVIQLSNYIKEAFSVRKNVLNIQ